MEAWFSLALLALVFGAGMRMGPKCSGIAARVCVVGFIGAAVFSRIAYASTERTTQTLMISGFLALLCLSAALTLIGPTVFRRWLPALALSVALNVALRLVPWPTWGYIIFGFTAPDTHF